MNFPTLAEHTVEILTKLITGRLESAAKPTGDALYDAVAGKVRRLRMSGVFDAFEAQPYAEWNRRNLTNLIHDQIAKDDYFRDTVSALFHPKNGNATPTETPVREKETKPEKTPEPARPIKEQLTDIDLDTPAGPGKRLLVGLSVLVVLGGMFFAGRALFSAGGSGGITCSQFWVTSYPEQRSLVERLYREQGNNRKAEDPYVVQSVLYDCGQDPERTIEDITEETSS